MSSAKWQRHSTFLSVRWRTWIGRALMASAFLANVGVGLLASGKPGQAGVPAPADWWWHPHGKKAGFSARDMATPGQLPGSARTANGAVHDGC